MPQVSSGFNISTSAQLGTGVVTSAAILDATINTADLAAAIKLAKPLSVLTAQVSLGANASETDILGNVSVPAGALQAGRSIVFECEFEIVCNNDTARFHVYYAGVDLDDFLITFPATNNVFKGMLKAHIGFVSAGNQYVSGMVVAVDNAAVGAASAVSKEITDVATKDETVAQNVKLTFSGSAGQSSFKAHGARIYII